MLPRKAADTGFSSRIGGPWVAEDVDGVVYVRTEDRVGAWPRMKHTVGCD